MAVHLLLIWLASEEWSAIRLLVSDPFEGRRAPGLRPRGRRGLWVPETLHMSCDLLIFVEEAADAVVSLDLADVGRRAVGERP